jgi:protein-S-isoprenylcysteine O-methyltransferase Ste14
MELVAIIVVALVGFGVFFFVLKRLLRMAIRLAVVGALLLALVAGAVAWWWYDPLGGRSENRNARPANTRPARPAR